MADQIPTQQIPDYSDAPVPTASQLTQVRVPLDQAGDALATPSANGRTPIVVLTVRSNRIVNSLVIAAGAGVVVCGGIGVVRGGITFCGLWGLVWIALFFFLFFLR